VYNPTHFPGPVVCRITHVWLYMIVYETWNLLIKINFNLQAQWWWRVKWGRQWDIRT
jgi:hypothetical protein